MISKIFIAFALIGLTFGRYTTRYYDTKPAYRYLSPTRHLNPTRYLSPTRYQGSNYRLANEVPHLTYRNDVPLLNYRNGYRGYTGSLVNNGQYLLRSSPFLTPAVRTVVQTAPAAPPAPPAPAVFSVFQAPTDDTSVPTPHDFAYSTTDEFGNAQTREESGDGYGNVRGSYTIQDINGLTRVVNYVADDQGFKADIQTNEPGTANQNPADVTISANPAQVVSQPALVLRSPVAVNKYFY